MSDKDILTFCLVIDASIARAAGGLDSTHPLGHHCRDFLMRMRGVCHRVAWGPVLEAEWQKHRSAFAAQWLTSMNNLRKLRRVDDTPSDELLELIADSTENEDIAAIMSKDAHLVTAALQTDSRIAALDDAVRGHFARCLRAHEEIVALVLVNPRIPEENCIEWLEKGAPPEATRQLLRFG